MKELRTTTYVNVESGDLTDAAESDLLDIIGSYGHDDKPFHIDWNDEDEAPTLKDWLITEFGESVKSHTKFMLKCY